MRLDQLEFEKIRREVDEAVIPRMFEVEDRLEMIVNDVKDMKKCQEANNQKKADKEELQLITMRLASFEKFDPKKVQSQVDCLDTDGKHAMQLLGQVSDQIRKVEGYAVQRADLTKVRGELAGCKAEIQKIQSEAKETSA